MALVTRVVRRTHGIWLDLRRALGEETAFWAEDSLRKALEIVNTRHECELCVAFAWVKEEQGERDWATSWGLPNSGEPSENPGIVFIL